MLTCCLPPLVGTQVNVVTEVVTETHEIELSDAIVAGDHHHHHHQRGSPTDHLRGYSPDPHLHHAGEVVVVPALPHLRTDGSTDSLRSLDDK